MEASEVVALVGAKAASAKPAPFAAETMPVATAASGKPPPTDAPC